MHFSGAIALLYSTLTVAAVLDEAAIFPCNEDNCYRAVNDTNQPPDFSVTARADCELYMTTTVVFNPIITSVDSTTTSTITVFPPCPTFPPIPTTLVRRQPALLRQHKRKDLEARQAITLTSGTIPPYATQWCTVSHYSSACRCIGVTPALATSSSITVTETLTVTAIDTSIGPCTPFVQPTDTPTSETISTSFISETTSSVSETSSSSETTSLVSETSSSSEITSSSSGTTSTFTITLSNSATTTITTVTISDPSSGTDTGTATSTESFSTGTSYSSTSCLSTTDSLPTPPFTNTSTFYTSETSSSVLDTTTTSNFSTTTEVPTNTTSSPSNTPTSNVTTTSDVPTNTTSSPTSSATPICGGGPSVIICNGVCTETSDDPQNCGACGNTCNPGFSCTNGVCTRDRCLSNCTESDICGPSNDLVICACSLNTEERGVCWNRRIDCAPDVEPSCNTTADCDVGSTCVPTACCGDDGGRCVTTEGCGSSGGSIELGARVQFGQMESWVVPLF